MPDLLIGFGRTLRSAIPVPGTLPAADATPRTGRHTEVRLLPALPADAVTQTDCAVHGDTLRIDVQALARFHCRPGEIRVAPCRGADAARIRAILVASALPAMLWLEGELLLHAGAVVLPGCERALVIAGPSGAGKSTITRALVGRGARLVADDCVALALVDGLWTASGLAGGWFGGGSVGWSGFQSCTAGTGVIEAPVASVMFVSRDLAECGIRPLGGLAGVEALLANRHRPELAALLGATPRSLRQCAGIASTTACRAWRRADGQIGITDAEFAALLALGAPAALPSPPISVDPHRESPRHR